MPWAFVIFKRVLNSSLIPKTHVGRVGDADVVGRFFLVENLGYGALHQEIRKSGNFNGEIEVGGAFAADRGDRDEVVADW